MFLTTVFKKYTQLLFHRKPNQPFPNFRQRDPAPFLNSQQREAALEMQIHSDLLDSWNSHLEQVVPQIKVHRQGLFYVLEIKELLSTGKDEYCIKWYQDPKNLQQTNRFLEQSIINAETAEITAIEFMDYMEKQLCDARREIHTREQRIRSYGWIQGILASGIRFGSESYYYKFAAGYFSFINELADHPSPELKKIPLADLKLTEEYKFFFTILGSICLIGLDIRIIGLNNTACMMVNNFGQRLMTTESALTLGKRIGLHDTQIIKFLPVTKQLFGLSLYMLLHMILMGWKPKIIGYLLAGYAATSISSKLVGSLLDWKHKKNPDPVAEKSWALFIKQPAQHIAGLASQYIVKYSYEYVTSHFFRTPAVSQALPESKETSLLEPKRCKEIALKALDLPADANPYDVKSRSRSLFFQFHTKEVTANDAMIVEVNNAKERLKDLKFLPEKK